MDPFYGTYCELCSGQELCKGASCDVDGLNGECAECVVNFLEVFHENNVTVSELLTDDFVEASIQNGTLPPGSTLDLVDMVIRLNPNNTITGCNTSCPPLVITNRTQQVDYVIDGECTVTCTCRWWFCNYICPYFSYRCKNSMCQHP